MDADRDLFGPRRGDLAGARQSQLRCRPSLCARQWAPGERDTRRPHLRVQYRRRQDAGQTGRVVWKLEPFAVMRVTRAAGLNPGKKVMIMLHPSRTLPVLILLAAGGATPAAA